MYGAQTRPIRNTGWPVVVCHLQSPKPPINLSETSVNSNRCYLSPVTDKPGGPPSSMPSTVACCAHVTDVSSILSVAFLVCRASQVTLRTRGIHTVRINFKNWGRAYELGNRPLDDNLTSAPTLPHRSLLLGRISPVWAVDDWRRGRDCVLSECHRRAVCRPVTLHWVD